MPTYPYTSGQSAIAQTFAQLRKGFPAKVDAGYLQRFGIASANESYIISILRFLELINEDGDRRDENTDFFFGGDDVFRPGLEKRVRAAYSQLFEEMGEETQTASREALTNWFRAADKTSALVGQRQASTFQTLLALAGHGDVPATRTGTSRKAVAGTPAPKKATTNKASSSRTSTARTPRPKSREEQDDSKIRNSSEVGLTVRIEVNLPPSGDAETYDAIFASIKKHLMA
jgi:hypothetical protein